MIIIQSEAQKNMAKQFGQNGICCDPTHSTNAYGFPLTSVLVTDECGEGVPFAWCISNCEDYSFMKSPLSKQQWDQSQHTGICLTKHHNIMCL